MLQTILARPGRRRRGLAPRQRRHHRVPAPGAVAPGADAAPGGRPGVPVPDLDHDRHPPAPVGRRAPQAPRLHRRRGRPALPRAARLGQGADAERGDVPPRGAATPRRSPATPRTCRRRRLDRLFYDHALLGLGIGVALLVRGVRVAGRPAGRVRPRQRLPRRIGGGERHRPPLRPPALRQHGRQPAVAGVHHGRRGAAQQPPRRADVGQAGPPLVRDRPRLVRDQGADVAPPGQGPPQRAAPDAARPAPRRRRRRGRPERPAAGGSTLSRAPRRAASS